MESQANGFGTTQSEQQGKILQQEQNPFFLTSTQANPARTGEGSDLSRKKLGGNYSQT